MLKPCAHGAAKYGIDPDQWQAHMCGLCLGLRDGHGQLARAATNTDAIVLSVLTEAQAGAAGRTNAAPCPLRGMRRASVVAADAPGVRLAATASLLLGAAKIRDHADDGDAVALARGPMRKVADSWATRAQRQADSIGLDVGPLLSAIAMQSALEKRAVASCLAERPPAQLVDVITLDDLTGPTQLCAATLFGHTATLAGRPENVAALAEIGRHVGRIAHLADAIEDLERDRARGRFNPLDATGTDMPRAYELVRESEASIRRAAAEAELDQVPTVRWALLDPLAALLRNLGRGLGLLTGHVCRVSANHEPYQFPSAPEQKPTAPGPFRAIGQICGVYCTGAACCVDHNSPCDGRRKKAWRKKCKDCCEACECCGNCGECGKCCGDGCCCDCNC
ncbi:DUF5685 family protein [Nocardia caishijiensis]|uniref:Regulatory protein n=1 Tax=Nocardia caishijiensis TaxID=184756 RepID=A0ABQ6YU14_9NOCA|nr:DUF5685 family protein [Nocardia caishijiensis]KAF0849297.1 hypothetical protein FNL39_101735 [Nocardia caishijiensis]